MLDGKSPEWQSPCCKTRFFSFFSQVVYDFLTALMCSVSSRANLLEKDYHNLKGLINNPLKMHETHQMCWKHVKKCQKILFSGATVVTTSTLRQVAVIIIVAFLRYETLKNNHHTRLFHYAAGWTRKWFVRGGNNFRSHDLHVCGTRYNSQLWVKL